MRTQLHQMMLLSTKCNWRWEGLRARDKKMKLDEEVDAEKEVDYDVSVWLEKDLYEALLLIREKQKLGIVQRHSLIA